ncbi:MAG: 50S ribosomal protein L13 [Candidatus Micrarchaeota archaeon]|nr:50S ribosomal protein L13 [Candidatus Micrarchaeota archaeon]
MLVVDGKGQVFGRMASKIAKALLGGEEVLLINAEKIILVGPKEYILEKFKTRRSWKNKANPEHSPHWPRRPDLLVKRMIRGMLPRKKATGRLALKRLKVIIGNPDNLEGVQFEEAKPKRLKSYMTIEELVSNLGWRNG